MPQVLPEGSVLGDRYVIETRLGDGAMGAVYRARHVQFTRYFAIKVLHRSLMENPKQVKRFEREAELAGRLRHTNAASVVDVGATEDGLRYMVMEFAPGEPLHALLLDGPFSEARTLDIAKQLCLGLQHAHDVGLIHRDLKPENVIVEHGRGGREIARIVDWGVSILRDDAGELDDERLTTKGIVVGTPHYMAPEQACGSTIDHRVDLFALGLVCYEMLAGKLPFEGTGVEVARANMQSEVPPIRERAPAVEVDAVLEALVRHLLAKNPADRPQNANAARELFELYERDRGACAQALGIAARERVKMEALVPVRAHSPSQAPEQLHATEEIRRRGNGWLVLVSLLGLASLATLATLIVVAVRADRRVAATTPPAMAIAVVADAALPVVATVADAAAVAEAPAIALAAPARRVETPARRSLPVATAASPPSGAEVAQLYAEVGRELRTLDEHKGMDATIDLWPRYRWIRIHEWLTTPERRTQATDMLARLRRDIRAQL